jgi:agmatinase
MRTGLDSEDLLICDLGDLNVTEFATENLERLELVTNEIFKANKRLAIIGGEHTLVLALVGEDMTIIDFDAHMDLRDIYNGKKISHGTVFRRIVEKIGSKDIIQIGVRAFSKKELEFARKKEIDYITTFDINQLGTETIIDNIRRKLAKAKRIHISIDLDVLDPAYAPATVYPEPDGISMRTLLDILQGICDERISSFDISEIVPQYDITGTTAIHAAKIISELLCFLEASSRKEKRY